LRLRKHLDGDVEPALWPKGIAPTALEAIDARKAHGVLELAFPGQVAPFSDWYGNLTQDSEFDPSLCVAAVTPDGQVAGFVQCWTSNFVKDLAVAPDYRRHGIGAALMNHAFALFVARGAPHVDLKVLTEEAPARRFYARVGMVEVPD